MISFAQPLPPTEQAAAFHSSLRTERDQVITMATKQATRTNQAITLKGSTALVTEFFEYSVNSILYQRGVYPSDDFRQVPVSHVSFDRPADHTAW